MFLLNTRELSTCVSLTACIIFFSTLNAVVKYEYERIVSICIHDTLNSEKVIIINYMHILSNFLLF